eukprot:3885338-Pyramimonas_sp.AAC.1
MSAMSASEPAVATALVAEAPAGGRRLDVWGSGVLAVGATVILEGGGHKEQGVVVGVDPVELTGMLAN